MIELMTKYGYAGLFFGVLADQIGIPMPSMLLVMAAGALAGLGELNLLIVLILAVAASLIGDYVWFEIGRRRGIRVLGFLCRFSLERDSCVRDTQDNFLRRGAQSLLFAKFLLGLSTVAPPMAGIIGMNPTRFLVYDTVGTVIWVGTFLGTGYLFSDRFGRIAEYVSQFGTGCFLLITAGLGVYLGVKYYLRRRFLKRILTARITATELKQKIDDGESLLIVDLRHRLDFESDPRLLPGAMRLSMDDLDARHHELPRDRDIILYCTCPNEATSASVAVKLHRRGITRVRPLAGGFTAWADAGFPLENNETAGIENEIY